MDAARALQSDSGAGAAMVLASPAWTEMSRRTDALILIVGTWRPAVTTIAGPRGVRFQSCTLDAGKENAETWNALPARSRCFCAAAESDDDDPDSFLERREVGTTFSSSPAK
jgi:hypothetical protein